MSTPTPPDPEWVDARKAAALLGVPGARNVHRLVNSGLITTRDLPGVRARYLRADIERLAAKGIRAPKPPLDYLFDIQPEPGTGGRLAFALARYKNERDRRRKEGLPPESDEPILNFGAAFETLTRLGDLALRQINHALDRDADSFLKALDGPDEGEDDDGFAGLAARLWAALAAEAGGSGDGIVMGPGSTPAARPTAARSMT